jgi:hypothetical protein
MKQRQRKPCPKCDRSIIINCYDRHVNSCNGIIKNICSIDESWKSNNDLYKCPYCNLEYTKKGISTHIWRMHGNGINHSPNESYKDGRIIWNKGLNKDIDPRVKQLGNTLSDRCKSGIVIPHFKGKHHTKESKQKMSICASKNNRGGKCKWFEVIKLNGEKYKVQGTWERLFSSVLNIIDENWIKPGVGNKEHTYKWIDDDCTEHNYTPDFYSPKLNKYFEVKGYWWGNDKRKMELVLSQHNINVEMIFKNELNQYIKLCGINIDGNVLV